MVTDKIFIFKCEKLSFDENILEVPVSNIKKEFTKEFTLVLNFEAHVLVKQNYLNTLYKKIAKLWSSEIT